MYELLEKVSYLRGLVEGLGINEDSKEGKIIVNMTDLLDDIVSAMAELDASQSDLDEYVETIDEDLSDVENFLYGDEEDDDDGIDDKQYVEVECPHCHKDVYFDEKEFDNEDDLVCPNCHDNIYTEQEIDDKNKNE